MKIVALADTHGKHESVDLPDGDVLVHAGDFTSDGSPEDVESFANWLENQSFEHRIVVAGNHELSFDPHDSHYGAREEAIKTIRSEATYLENESVTVGEVTFFGSPNTPTFDGWAFEEDEEDLERIYQEVSSDTDVLVTHTPPRNVLDRVAGSFKTKGVEGALINQTHKSVGSKALLEAVQRIEPEVHLFGHIHPQYGHETFNGTAFYNVAQVSERLEIVNDPVVIDV